MEEAIEFKVTNKHLENAVRMRIGIWFDEYFNSMSEEEKRELLLEAAERILQSYSIPTLDRYLRGKSTK